MPGLHHTSRTVQLWFPLIQKTCFEICPYLKGRWRRHTQQAAICRFSIPKLANPRAAPARSRDPEFSPCALPGWQSPNSPGPAPLRPRACRGTRPTVSTAPKLSPGFRGASHERAAAQHSGPTPPCPGHVSSLTGAKLDVAPEKGWPWPLELRGLGQIINHHSGFGVLFSSPTRMGFIISCISRL